MIDYSTYPALEQAYDRWSELYTKKLYRDLMGWDPIKDQKKLDEENEEIKQLRACAVHMKSQCRNGGGENCKPLDQADWSF